MRGPTEAFFHRPGYFKGSPNDCNSRAQAASHMRHFVKCFLCLSYSSLFLLLLIGNRRRVRLNACSSNDELVRCYGLLDVRT